MAQMVVKQIIEPDLDAVFLGNSYGYRPGRSALDAVGVTRKRCWDYDWVLAFDIKGAPSTCWTGFAMARDWNGVLVVTPKRRRR